MKNLAQMLGLSGALRAILKNKLINSEETNVFPQTRIADIQIQGIVYVIRSVARVQQMMNVSGMGILDFVYNFNLARQSAVESSILNVLEE
jgi:hypothetical protein